MSWETNKFVAMQLKIYSQEWRNQDHCYNNREHHRPLLKQQQKPRNTTTTITLLLTHKQKGKKKQTENTILEEERIKEAENEISGDGGVGNYGIPKIYIPKHDQLIDSFSLEL